MISEVRGLWGPGAGVMDSCELPCLGAWEPSWAAAQERHVSLMPPPFVFWNRISRVRSQAGLELTVYLRRPALGLRWMLPYAVTYFERWHVLESITPLSLPPTKGISINARGICSEFHAPFGFLRLRSQVVDPSPTPLVLLFIYSDWEKQVREAIKCIKNASLTKHQRMSITATILSVLIKWLLRSLIRSKANRAFHRAAQKISPPSKQALKWRENELLGVNRFLWSILWKIEYWIQLLKYWKYKFFVFMRPLE